MKRISEIEGIKVFIGGYDDKNIESKMVWDGMVSALCAGLRIPPIISRSKDVFTYMEMYKQIDIMLIPLVKTEFNGMKSNLKVLEAASKKIPVIVSKVDPYLDIPHVCYVESQQDWYRHVKRLVKDPVERRERGEALYEWAVENYDIRKVNEQRCNHIMNSISKTSTLIGQC